MLSSGGSGSSCLGEGREQFGGHGCGCGVHGTGTTDIILWTYITVYVKQNTLYYGITLFHWTVELLHPLTHSRSVSRHFSLIRHNHTVARTSVLWRDINWLIDWLINWLLRNNFTWTESSWIMYYKKLRFRRRDLIFLYNILHSYCQHSSA